MIRQQKSHFYLAVLNNISDEYTRSVSRCCFACSAEVSARRLGYENKGYSWQYAPA